MRHFLQQAHYIFLFLALSVHAQVTRRAPVSERLMAGVNTVPKENASKERPNCAGVAIYNTGVATTLEYVDPAYELPGILQKCYALNEDGPTKGDIGVLFDRKQHPVHVWVEVGDKHQALAKNGDEATAIQVQSRKDMIKFYKKNFGGKRVRYYAPLLDAVSKKRCQVDLKKFRQDSWKGSGSSH